MPARPPPSASHSAATIHRGCECTTARWSSASSSYGGATCSSHASRSCAEIRRSTALTNFARPSPSTARASSTVAETAAWVGMRVESNWWAPSASTSSTGGSTSRSGRSTQAAITASYVPWWRSVP